MSTPFHTTQAAHGAVIRVIHSQSGRQVAQIKARHPQAGELQRIRDLIEGKA